jgi:hypothetical protein
VRALDQEQRLGGLSSRKPLNPRPSSRRAALHQTRGSGSRRALVRVQARQKGTRRLGRRSARTGRPGRGCQSCGALAWAAHADAEAADPVLISVDAIARAGRYLDYAAAMLDRVTAGMAIGPDRTMNTQRRSADKSS